MSYWAASILQSYFCGSTNTSKHCIDCETSSVGMRACTRTEGPQIPAQKTHELNGISMM